MLWSGDIGGAETASLTLVRALQANDARVGAVFVGRPSGIGERLSRLGVPVHAFDAEPGSRILLSPRRYAAAVGAVGRDGAILISGGAMVLGLRLGGYRGRVVTVEHGALAQLENLTFARRARALAMWRLGSHFVDRLVAVSSMLTTVVAAHSPGREVVAIPNGIDPTEFAPRERHPIDSGDRECILGVAGRLVPGKGLELLLEASALAARSRLIRLRVAGDGSLRELLVHLARETPENLAVEFLGWSSSMPDFWAACDIAVVPTDGLVESFGMTALEAMSCGRPVIASDSGALPELVAHGTTGLIVRRGDRNALARAIGTLADSPELRRAFGAAGRARVLSRYESGIVARSYLSLFAE